MSLKKTVSQSPAPKLSKNRGGQHEPAPLLVVPRALRNPQPHVNSAEAYVQSGEHARALTIKASNEKLGAHCKALEAKQVKLRQELAFWEDPDEAWQNWDSLINNL